MSEAPRPAPYPADTRARGWRFELDYEQIDQSDTWGLAAEVPMAQHALLMMWLVAWRQEPCGSFPNDETLIRAKCRIPPRVWAQCRELMMRGWWLADDGRLYHDTVAKRVLEMLAAKKKERERKADYRARLSQGDPAMSHGTTTGQTGDHHGKDVTGTSNTSSSSSLRSEEDPPKPPRKRRGAGTRICPDDFAVTAEMVLWAEKNAPGVNLDRETTKFRNHEFDKPKTEWSKTWMNWMLRACERGGASPDTIAPSRVKQPAESFAERDRRLAMERWEQMTGQVHPDREPRAPLAHVIDETIPALGAPA